MMKRYFIGSFLCAIFILAPMHANTTTESQLLAALKNTDEKTVFQMVIMENATVDKESKKYLFDAAEELVAQKEKSISLLKSWRDLGVFGCGLGCMALGGLFFHCAYVGRFYPEELVEAQKELNIWTHLAKKDFQFFAPGALGIALSLVGLGGYYAKKGWICNTALHLRENALRIQGLIKKVPTSEIKNSKLFSLGVGF
ncbi:hypothetical protein H0X06_05690 [Candidatus Dependentiae bacterium]|nr:hypothetical protein [Candidatus Dependentiae bacterium]